MHRCQKKCSLPRLWLFTDERVTDDALIAAVGRLPRGSGIVFRHYGLGRAARKALFLRLSKAARRRGLVLLLAASAPQPGIRHDRIDGFHMPEWRPASARPERPALFSTAVHRPRGLIAAGRAGADLAFLSPVFPTRSHPEARTLGPVRFGLIARATKLPVIALGGMDAARFRRLRALGAHGWAAIDALTHPPMKA